MRIVTWNCVSRFADKKQLLYKLRPDLAVIQECSEKCAVSCQDDGYSVIWRDWQGSNKNKGVAVIARDPWKISLLEEPKYKLLVPVSVSGPAEFLLVGVWACKCDSANESYVAQTFRAVQDRADWFERDVVFSGDFNSNSIWDRASRPFNHGGMVALLKERGLRSVYHFATREDHGAETAPTFYLYRHQDKPYHLDYTFVPKRWNISGVKVEDYAAWASQSDHVPVIADCVPRKARATKQKVIDSRSHVTA